MFSRESLIITICFLAMLFFFVSVNDRGVYLPKLPSIMPGQGHLSANERTWPHNLLQCLYLLHRKDPSSYEKL